MLKKFGKYILQIIAGMIGISIYILADTYFISVYAGADGLAVLNLILPVYGVMYAVGALIGIGSATRYGLDKATGKNTDTCFLHSLLWSLLCSIPFVLVGIFSPFFICNYTFTAFARNDHATSTSMLGSIAGSMFNIVFDYVFMFSLHLGLAGAALATGFCPDVTMLICSTHFLGKHNQVGFHRPHLSIRRLIDCCKLGVSAFVGEIFSGVITIIFNMLILGIAGNMGCLHLSGSGTADRRCKLAVYRSPGKISPTANTTRNCSVTPTPDCGSIFSDFSPPESIFFWSPTTPSSTSPALPSSAPCSAAPSQSQSPRLCWQRCLGLREYGSLSLHRK